MKKKHVFFIFCIFCILFSVLFISCHDELLNGDPDSTFQLNSKSLEGIPLRSMPTIPFNWQTADWMPTPAGQSQIPAPWIGQGSLASQFGLDVINDRYDGWYLVYSTFNSNASGPLQNPYFMIYNEYRGLLRIFMYVTTPFISPSSYLQDGISVNSNQPTKMLNFLGESIVDGSQYKNSYLQLQPAPLDGSFPLASNKWYMMQYELAYDPNVVNIPSNQIQLKWFVNYYNVQQINLGGSFVGTLNGTIGSNNSGIFSALSSAGTKVGTGILAGIGSDFISNNTLDASTGENKLGLNKTIFKDITKGISSAMSGAAAGLPGVAANLLSALIGGNKVGATTVSFNLDAKITLTGNGTSGGSLPSMPISFWMPGTNISSDETGYIPLYNKPMGVINMVTAPEIIIKLDYSYVPGGNNPHYVDDIDYNTLFTYYFPSSIDYSSYLKINPEVLKIADVSIKKQELIMDKFGIIIVNPDVDYQEYSGEYPYSGFEFLPDGGPYESLGVRFTIEVKPKNGSPASMIIKTFKLKQKSELI